MPYGPPPWQPSPKPARKSGTKPIRVTLDLDPAEYEVLNLWLARASVELDQPVSKMTLARGIKAMIRAAAGDNVVSGVVLDQLRSDQT